MKKLEIAKVILEALFLIGLVGFMVASIKADQNRQDDIDKLNIKITDLQTTIGEQGTATKAELERMKGTLDKMSENDKAHTEQIEGLTTNLDKMVKEMQKKVEELEKKLKELEEAKAEKATEPIIEASYTPTPAYSAPSGGCLTPSSGVYNGPSGLETYYNLPMDGVIQQARNYGIEGEYWVRDDGVKMYGDYVICACNRDVHPMGSLVETSLGTGISLDTGGFAAGNPTQCDIAVSW